MINFHIFNNHSNIKYLIDNYLDNFLNNCLEMTCNLLENMVNNIIELKVNELLLTIYNKYPDKFTKSNLESEKEYISELQIYTYPLQPFYISTNSISSNIISTNSISTNINVDNRKKCSARVWGKIKINKNTNEIIEIGRQCKNWGNINGYCVKHFNKLTHGDYLEQPTQNLIEHFKIKSNIEYC